jgi:hypothetical protein
MAEEATDQTSFFFFFWFPGLRFLKVCLKCWREAHPFGLLQSNMKKIHNEKEYAGLIDCTQKNTESLLKKDHHQLTTWQQQQQHLQNPKMHTTRDKTPAKF